MAAAFRRRTSPSSVRAARRGRRLVCGATSRRVVRPHRSGAAERQAEGNYERRRGQAAPPFQVPVAAGMGLRPQARPPASISSHANSEPSPRFVNSVAMVEATPAPPLPDGATPDEVGPQGRYTRRSRGAAQKRRK